MIEKYDIAYYYAWLEQECKDDKTCQKCLEEEEEKLALDFDCINHLIDSEWIGPEIKLLLDAKLRLAIDKTNSLL